MHMFLFSAEAEESQVYRLLGRRRHRNSEHQEQIAPDLTNKYQAMKNKLMWSQPWAPLLSWRARMQRGQWTPLQRDGQVLQQTAKVLVVLAYTAGFEGPRVCPQQQYPSVAFGYSKCQPVSFLVWGQHCPCAVLNSCFVLSWSEDASAKGFISILERNTLQIPVSPALLTKQRHP